MTEEERYKRRNEAILQAIAEYSPLTTETKRVAGLCERLERKHQMAPVRGSGSISIDSGEKVSFTSTITDDGYRLVNTDGPEAAAELRRLAKRVDDLENMRNLAQANPDYARRAPSF